ncbi:hypothetical protein DASC09_047260 [Saccharomycopsis crataegensis]|uniref:LSM2-LSM8 complex subunit LSM8 n=1 Tax=Saccharomycopsis crataegensis TaxID=43959 RepID=A0AAV5QS99_9ASCO|nr:hypothetical protein DASC09_047260 [Saccharomycopsis crataegensis]
MSYLAPFQDQRVSIITTDGRFFIGLLKFFDLSTNVVLQDTKEIIIKDIQDEEDQTQVIDLGVYLIRGDCMVCCGLNDEQLENQIDWMTVEGEPLKTTKNKI